MNKSKFLHLLVALVLCTSALAQPLKPARPTTLDQAVTEVRQEFAGSRVLSAQTERVGGREVHAIRILTMDGRVKNLRIDAATGHPVDPMQP